MSRSSRAARFLRGVGCLQVLAAAVWAFAWTPERPWTAATGAGVILLLPPIVLAIEFVLLAFVARADGRVPLASPLALLRAWCAETAQLYRVFHWRQPLHWRRPPDYLPTQAQGRRGVVLIHGFVCNRGFWAPWMEQLRSLGHPCVAVNLEPLFADIDAYVTIVEEAVRRVTECSGGPPLLLCHSMGGLVARAWLRATGAPERVEHVVTIASPHHGTWLGRFSRRANGLQMRLQSDWLRQLESDERTMPRPPWTCWYSNCDNVVFPPATAWLPGADNRFLPGRAHVSLAFQPEVLQATLATLASNPEFLSR